MGYDTASKTDPESVVPEEFGGMWFLKDELDATTIGLTVLELEPGGKGKEHDESATGQEEVYYVVSGTVDIHLDGETVSVGPEEAIRLDPDQRRQIENTGDERATLVLAGAPLGRN
jgi:mannose-6-phosphate isomerase-like protein (cupin superfamily)